MAIKITDWIDAETKKKNCDAEKRKERVRKINVVLFAFYSCYYTFDSVDGPNAKTEKAKW